MKKYVAANNITDILFANNIFKAYSSSIYRSYLRFLEQSDHSVFKAVVDSTTTDTIRQNGKRISLGKDTTLVHKNKVVNDVSKQEDDTLSVI